MNDKGTVAESSENSGAYLDENKKTPPETLFSWLFTLGKAGVKSLPSMAATLLIQIGVVILIQIVFWWNAVARYIPGFIKGPVIFLTATYNDIIPKTLYWIIVFTFGKKLFHRIRKAGFSKALEPIARLLPEFKKTLKLLSKKAYPLLLLGGGIGLAVANNFASYSRFSGARNKIDKYFVALVISFTISYLLGEGRKHWIFKFSRLAASDFSKAFKIRNHYTDDHAYVLLSGFVAGLLLDAPLILMNIKYGGYILGAACVAAAVVVRFLPSGAPSGNS